MYVLWGDQSFIFVHTCPHLPSRTCHAIMCSLVTYMSLGVERGNGASPCDVIHVMLPKLPYLCMLKLACRIWKKSASYNYSRNRVKIGDEASY